MSAPETIVGYLGRAEDRAAVEAALAEQNLRGVLHQGTIHQAIEDAAEWTVVPQTLILDVRGEADPLRLLAALAEAGPEGESGVILVGSENDVGLYRRLKAHGAFEYLLAPLTVEEVAGALKVLRQARVARGEEIDAGKLTVVTGPRGGSGISTVACTVAQGLAQRHGRRTLMIDLDVEGGSAHVQFDVDQTIGFLEVLENPERIDAVYLNRTVSRPLPNLALLSTVTAPGSMLRVTDANLRQFIIRAERGFDQVLLDIPAHAGFGREVVAAAGQLLLVVPPSIIGLRDTVQSLNHLERRGFSGQAIVLLNMVGARRSSEVEAKEFRDRVNRPVVEIPWDPRQVASAAMGSRFLLDESGRAAKALETVLQMLPSAPKPQKRGLFWGLFK